MINVDRYLISYQCNSSLDVARLVTETDPINAIIAARREERRLVGLNCPDCVLVAVTRTS